METLDHHQISQLRTEFVVAGDRVRGMRYLALLKKRH